MGTTTNNVERENKVEIAIMGEDLDPRIANDARIESMWKTKLFPLQEGQNLKIGVTIDEKYELRIRQVLTDTTDLFAWITTNL